MSLSDLQPSGPSQPGGEGDDSLIAGEEPPGFDPWTDLGHWFEPQWLSNVIRSGTSPFYVVEYAPSFYRGCGIVVVEWPGAAEVRLVKFVGELTARGRDQLRKEGWSQHGPPPPDLERWEEIGRADQRQIDRFHKGLPMSIPLRPEDSACPGCDGMDVRCWYRWGGWIGATKSWQDQEPATFQLARAVHRLASEVLLEPTSLETLGVIGMFLG